MKVLNKKWREENKEKIQEQKKEIIVCECGHQITFGNKYKHLQSKIHLDYQNKLTGEHVVETQISEEEKKKILHEKQKEYREKNADKIKKYKKIYNENHKENNREQKKKYYDEHKSQIIEQNRQYVEENKEHIKEYKDEWYQKNKEKILAKQKLTFVCECGSVVRCAGKAEHLRSAKHQKYTENKTEDLI